MNIDDYGDRKIQRSSSKWKCGLIAINLTLLPEREHFEQAWVKPKDGKASGGIRP
jgi:hypothetical protein